MLLCCTAFLSNCGILPYLIPNSQFLPSSVITSVLASHPALHLTAKPLTHSSRRTLFPDPALSLEYKQPFMGASLTSSLTLSPHPSVKLILKHRSHAYSITNPLCITFPTRCSAHIEAAQQGMPKQASGDKREIC